MYKNSVIILSMLLAFVGFLPLTALSHGGGLDSDGGHFDNKAGSYHYHGSGSSKGTSRSAGSSSGTFQSSTFSGGASRVVPTFSKKSASGLSNEDYELNPDCKKFTFSQILNQANRGYVRIQCGQLVMSIIAH